MRKVFDKNGKAITEHSEVLVPEPTGTDVWNHEFAGQIIDILDNGDVIVEDGDSDCFTIEADRLEVIND